MLIKTIRNILGQIIIFFDHITRPPKMQRNNTIQKTVNDEIKNLSLYQFHACPFCIRVRRTLHHLNLPIELRDAKNNSQYRMELLNGGGKIKVPCLKTEENGKVTWMYESKAIIKYLNKRFGARELKPEAEGVVG